MKWTFTTAQLASAPSAWTRSGRSRLVTIAEASTNQWTGGGAGSDPLSLFREVLCPVVAETETDEVVVMPDGFRMTLPRCREQ